MRSRYLIRPIRIFLLLVDVVSKVQGFVSSFAQCHYQLHHRFYFLQALANDDDGNDHNNNNPSAEWKGTSYSWTPPAHRQQRTGKKVVQTNNGTTVILQKIIPMQHCDDSIEIEEHPKDQILTSSTDRTGVVLWSAAYSLAEYIDVQCENLDSWKSRPMNTTTTASTICSPQQQQQQQRQRRTCLELGAGLGLPSMVAAKHGWDCILTESDPKVLPLLEQNLKRNNLQVTKRAPPPRPEDDNHKSNNNDDDNTNFLWIEPLDWTCPEQVEALCTQYPSPHLIIASDLIYQQTRPVWKSLLSVIDKLRLSYRQQKQLQQQQQQEKEEKTVSALERFDGSVNHDDPLVLLGYTQRRRNLDVQGEREFFHLLDEMGIEAVMIPFDQVPNSDKRLLTMLFELRWKT